MVPGSPFAADAGAGDGDAPTIVVVDDDDSMRRSLDGLLRSVGLRVNTYASIADMLRGTAGQPPSCLVLDVRLPGLSGLDFQTQATQLGNAPPIIFMTGYGDIPMTVRAMKAGALDFLSKPFRDQDLLDAVNIAIRQARRRQADLDSVAAVQQEFAALTAREREVMEHVVAGLMNKQIAHELSVSEITVKVHRGSVMRKMQVRSLPDLVRKAELLGMGGAAARKR
jgi:FixJ family two-component response regulator